MQKLSSLLCLCFLLCGSLARANVDYVVLQLEGLACPFCNTHVIRLLEEAPGAYDVQTDLALNQVHFFWNSECVFRPWVFRNIIERAGYTLAGVYVMASGYIQNSGDGDILSFSNCPDGCSFQTVSGWIHWCGCGPIELQVDDVACCE